MGQANPDFDRVAASTLKNYVRSNFADNISKHIPFWGILKSRGAVMEDGGDTLVVPLVHEFVNSQTYQGSDVINIDKQDGISAAEYNWKQLITPVVIEGIEKARNMGKHAQVKLLDGLIQQAQLSHENKISEMITGGDGTGNSGKDLLGLEALAALDPTNDTLGGISSASYTFWRNYTNAAVGSFATNGLDTISLAIRETKRGMDKVDIIVMDTTNYGRLEKLANNRAEFQNPKLAGLGFEGLKVNGVDAIHDDNVLTDRVIGVNTNWTKIYIHSDMNNTTGKFIEPANQDIGVAKIRLYAQLATQRRESLFHLSGFTA